MTIDNLLDRAARLKEELVAYGLGSRYHRARGEVLAEFDVVGVTLSDTGHVDEEESRLIRALDHFVLEHRLRNGRTVVEQFVAARPDLPEAERAMLLGWRDVIHSVFEVEHHDAGALVAVNLVDELTYRIRSNMGPSLLRAIKPGWFLFASVVPVAEEWMISGTLLPQPASEQQWAHELALKISMQNPEGVYRNPAKLAKAWELQQFDRERFIRFFGTDVLVLPGTELQGRMDAYWDFARDEAAGERSSDPHDLVMTFPDELTSADTVGVV